MLKKKKEIKVRSPKKKYKTKRFKKLRFLRKAKLFVRKFAQKVSRRKKKRRCRLKRHFLPRYREIKFLRKTFSTTRLLKKRSSPKGRFLKMSPPIRKRLYWLTNAYSTYKDIIPVKLRKDFFKTIIGRILTSTHYYSYAYIPR
jgi:hypothetical protein